MTQATPDDVNLPVWARHDAFPDARSGYGWVDPKGRRHDVVSRDELIRLLAQDDRAEMMLVWSPESCRMILPEELDGATAAVAAAKARRATHERKQAVVIMAGIGVWLLTLVWIHASSTWGNPHPPIHKVLEILDALKHSMMVGVALLLFLIVGFIPWYQSSKRLRELGHDEAGAEAAILPVLRFETWMELQRAPLTRGLAGLMVLVALVQWSAGGSIEAAGLVKSAYRQGEWWRLFTAPMLHGNVVHLIMNVSALLYLGKRVELFARWPHLLLVFLFAATVGGVCSARWLDAPSVGASGGLLGWLGFLLVFESLHGRLVPRSAKRRLLAGLVLTAFMGVIGYRFIDNAAHFGGAVAGMVYALIVFPPSGSNRRPLVTLRDRFAGSLAAVAILAATATAVWRIMAS